MKQFVKTHYPVLIVSFSVLLLHFFNNAFTTFGYFRDELYFIACTNHLDIGYVDHPPFAVFYLWLNRLILGDSIFALRLFPSIAHASVVLFGAILAEKLGGKTFAQMLAALCIALAPGLMGMFGIFTVNAFDIIAWQIVFYLILRLLETEQPKYWVLIGVMMGIGLLSKISMSWLMCGVAVGTVATPMRRWLRTPYPWISAGISLIIFFPYLIWNFQHDFAHIEFAKNAAGIKYASLSSLSFIIGMIDHFNPVSVPVWMLGYWVLFRQSKKEWRILFFSVVSVLGILILNGHSKTEYFNPAIVILFAAGSVKIEELLTTSIRLAAGYVYIVLVVFIGLVTIPFAIDILPVKSFILYSQALGEELKSNEGKRLNALPQHFADRFGWEELTVNVSKAYSTLSRDEQSSTVIYGNNYGQAGAIEFFGKSMGLPSAISGHNSYWIWGYGNAQPKVVIITGGREADHKKVFQNVEQVLIHSHPYAMPYESNIPIYVCKNMKLSLTSAWISTKHFD